MMLVTLFVLRLVTAAQAQASARQAQEPAPAKAAAPAPAQPDPREARHLRNIRQLTTVGKNGEAYFSKDGKRVIFQSVRGDNPYYQMYTMNADGTAQTRLSNDHGKCTCGYFDPLSTKMLYASTHLDANAFVPGKSPPPPPAKPGDRYKWDFDPAMDIFEVAPGATEPKQLTKTPGYDAEGSYSHDGKRIVFTSQRDGDLEIYTMNRDGTKPVRLTHAKGYDGGPFFSPDDKRIVWRGFRAPDERVGEIFIMSADGKGEKQLTQLHAVSWAPFFHPDGKRLIFASNADGMKEGKHGNFELYLMKDDGSALERVTFSDGFDGLPVFSADGKHLMWTSTRAGGESQIYIADWKD
jgi:Tol biopolymer transport system component